MSKILKTFGIDKISLIFQSLRQNGGIFGALKNSFVNDSFKVGTLMGTDKYGNKYYENKYYFYGRDRWVVYNEKSFLDQDASMVSPEWHGWLHHSTDHTPISNPPEQHKWSMDHVENMSGTTMQYVPYSTTRPKISSWTPGAPRNLDPRSQIKAGN